MMLVLLSSPLVLIPFILFSISLLFFIATKRSSSSSSSTTTLLKSYPIVGTLPHVIKNSKRMLDWSTELLTATPTVRVFPFVFTADPSNVEHVTMSNFASYPKPAFLASTLHDLLGGGIFAVHEEKWQHQRKTASYAFSTASLRAILLQKVHGLVQQRLIPLLASASGNVLDMQDVLDRFGFDAICSIVFDYDPGCLSATKNEEGHRFFHAFEEAECLSVDRAMLPFPMIWKIKKLFDIGSERRLRESFETIDKMVERFIVMKADRAGKKEFTSFLSLFVHSDNIPVRDALVNFVVAGRDTTATALTWFFWILFTWPSGPDALAKIREEIRSNRARHELGDGQFFTLDALREMNYLHAALSETMRFYPPVSLHVRECKADEDTLADGAAVRKGQIMMYSAYAMGRSARIWGEDCSEFRPERWLANGVFRPKNPFEYPVFSAGPRMCLGKDMAFIQMKAVAASVLERFDMEVVEKRGKHKISMVLKMAGGLPVRVQDRQI